MCGVLKALCQLLIAALWFGTFKVPKALKERFRKEAESEYLEKTETDKRVSNALEDKHFCQFFVEGLFVKVEFYFPRTNTILRVDWPSMLRPDGKQSAKVNLMTKCLERLGFRVVRVGYREFKDSSESELKRMLNKLLK